MKRFAILSIAYLVSTAKCLPTTKNKRNKCFYGLNSTAKALNSNAKVLNSNAKVLNPNAKGLIPNAKALIPDAKA
jgi:hypothetical protein